jgi:hypothetical protein
VTDASDDEVVSASGSSVRRLTGTPSDAVPDLSLLDSERQTAYDDELRAAGGAPYADGGDLVTWHYGRSADVLRVVRDDVRGLVAWLPGESEQLASLPVDGRALRDRPLVERFTAEREFRIRRWVGPGILRIAPTGRPWSLWYFYDDAGGFEGHYLNLELTHERPVDGRGRVHTRDLVLDLWLENGETWLKDDDELDAVVEVGRFTPEQAVVVRAIAEQARREQVDPRAWPLDEGWEDWRPPPGWETPLRLPDDVLDTMSKSGHVVRRTDTTS